MSKISFSTKPQKVYYSYVSDGHIYDITTKKPEITADGGGYWSCYFECEPYYKHTDGKTYLLYEQNGTEYIPTTNSSFNSGKKYYWLDESGTPTAFSGSKYYTRNGKTDYDMPKSAAELPYIDYPTKNSVRYYLDTLIKSGAKYDTNKFVPMDITVGASTTTFGDILLGLVEDSISINAFNACVNDLPDYLTGGDITKKYEVGSIGYSIPANYLITFGTLFMKKLNETMKEKGDSIVKKYMDSQIDTTYKKVTITTEVTGETPVGKVTSTPSA